MTGTGEAGKSASGDSSRQQSPFTCRCGSSWTGQSRAHCAGCHTHTFATVALFENHRRGFQCIDPATIDGIELRGGLWSNPEMTEEQRAKMARIWGKEVAA